MTNLAFEAVRNKSYLIATDLDGTLLGSGEKYEEMLELFKKVLTLGSFTLVYVTGRNLQEIQEAIESYRLPLPQAAIAEIGTRIFRREGEVFIEDTSWDEKLLRSVPGWDRKKIMENLFRFDWLFKQSEDHQNPFKISYHFINHSGVGNRLDEVRDEVGKICSNFEFIISLDPKSEWAFLDIVPSKGTKAGALEYLRRKLGFGKNQVIYAGDSGNDLHALTAGYWSVVVRNASEELKRTVADIAYQRGLSSRVYFAQGCGKIDGKYVSGLIEALIKLRVIPPHLLSESK